MRMRKIQTPVLDHVTNADLQASKLAGESPKGRDLANVLANAVQYKKLNVPAIVEALQNARVVVIQQEGQPDVIITYF